MTGGYGMWRAGLPLLTVCIYEVFWGAYCFDWRDI
jgi:hypothetical protein